MQITLSRQSDGNVNKKIAKVEVRIPADVKENFADKCEVQGRTVSETVREFIHEHINDDSPYILRKIKSNLHTFLAIIGAIIVILVIIISLMLHEEAPDPKLIKVFTQYDIDQNQKLTLSDFTEYKRLKLIKISSGKSNVDSGFLTGELPTFISVEKFNSQFNPEVKLARYDLNLDGEVDITEFLDSKPRLNFITWPTFELVDANNDKLVSKSELLIHAKQWYDGWPAGNKRAKLQTNAKLWKLDTDKNGYLSNKEYDIHN